MTTNERTVGRYLRWLLAALSLGAGAVHLAVSGDHYELSWMHGTFFAVVGWLQISWAIGVVLRPSRKLLTAGAIFNAVIIGVWVMSRVWGVPIGPDAWAPESIALADALSSGCEFGIVALSLAVLVRPAMAQHELRPGFAVPVVGAAGLGVAVIASLALTPAFASSHDHTSASGHDHASTDASTAASAPAGHTHGATDLNGHRITGVKAQDVATEQQPDQPLDAATRALLQEQLTTARSTALRYPTVADAEAAGYRLVAGFGPGSGAHYIGGPMTGPGPFDATKPQSLLYDGISPTSQMVGLMYFGMGDTPPEGFAGPNDHWHRHSSVCTTFQNGMIDVPFPPDSDITEAQCASAGGHYMKITGWMVHAWVVPSWESPAGVFSHENPDLRCADGTFNTDTIGKCQGS